jgi:radical SAM superfamily enzyme YgiQ (UPF0313 family)
MRIALVALGGVRVKNAELARLGVTLPGFVRRGEVIASLPSLGLLTVAGLTPGHHEVTYIEVNGPVDEVVLPEADLVALSSFTARSDEAYALAGRCRTSGTAVVLGGLHATMLPDEALRHVDAVVRGGAEGAWPRLLEDLERGALQAVYEGARSGVFAPPLYAMPRFDLLAGRPYNRVTVQTTRGCPRRCEFCAASLRISRGYSVKPVDLVVAEVRAAQRHFPEPFFELADDNTFLDRTWSRQLLRALAREEIRFFTETDLSVAGDLELCGLLAAAGCKQVLIGLESPRASDLAGMDPRGWKRRQVPKMLAAIDALQSRGVGVNGCFILGLDGQSADVFPEVLDFVRSSGLADVQYTVLTPFPGTPLFERLRREGRLLSDRFWDRCTLFDVAYRPDRMSVEELETGLRWLFAETYGAEAARDRRREFVRRRAEGRQAARPIAERLSGHARVGEPCHREQLAAAGLSRPPPEP